MQGHSAPAGGLRPNLVQPRAVLYNLTWAGLLLGTGGLLWLTQPHGRRLLTLTGVSFVAIVVFNLFYGIGDIYVYYIPAYLIGSLWIAFGIAAAGAWLARLVGRLQQESAPVTTRLASAQWPLVIGVLLALALPAWLLVTNYREVDQSQNRSAQVGWADRLGQPIPEGAVLVTNDRDEMMPMWYYQTVDGIRPDLIGLFPLIVPGPQWSNVGQVTEQAQRSGRPVFLIKPMPGLEVKFNLEPAGSLMHVVSQAALHEPENATAVDFAGAMRLIGYDVQPAKMSAGRPVTVTLYWQALHPLPDNYTTFVHLQDANGEKVGQDDHRPGGDYYPSSLWRPGETLQDEHRIILPELRPEALPYTIIAGVYSRSPNVQNLDEPKKIGELR